MTIAKLIENLLIIIIILKKETRRYVLIFTEDKCSQRTSDKNQINLKSEYLKYVWTLTQHRLTAVRSELSCRRRSKKTSSAEDVCVCVSVFHDSCLVAPELAAQLEDIQLCVH